ncbi:hypothetical protein J3R30DRAFT_934614 [Lentinula aciculospora]|uniref:F-box domain-containing protein n=1 Tax=Lentinula aciculospora TaxID=153920 RepID=A0A9W9AS21_9AGAR|nr:hypothetical protein J3R30DRAFT_934614 [Lentinula aciculospora]
MNENDNSSSKRLFLQLSKDTIVTPIPHLLGTNGTLKNEAEIQSLQGFIKTAEGKLKTVDELMLRTQRAFHCMSSYRTRLMTVIQTHRPFLSVKRNIPDDVLREIFIHCCASQENGPLARSPPQLALTQVCRAWRTVAVTCPRLWSNITFKTSLAVTPVLNGRYLQLQQWIERSGGVPLTIHVVRTHYDPTTDINFVYSHFRLRIEPAMNLMVAHCLRWANVNLCFVTQEDAKRILAPVRGELPLLHTLRLQTEYADVQQQDSVLHLFNGAPKLHILDLTYHFSFFADSFPWGQLTSCTLIKPGPMWAFEALSILPHTPALTVLQANYPSIWRDQNIMLLNPIEHKSLRKLVLFEIGASGAITGANLQLGQILEALTLPMLTELILHCCTSPWCQQQFLDFASRSQKITKLELQSINFSPNQLVQCLRATSAITHLTLRVFNNNFSDPNLLSALTLQPNLQQNCMLLSLQTLVLVGPALLSPMFLDMLTSRWSRKLEDQRNKSLQQVVVDLEGMYQLAATSDDDFIRLGMMKQNGFQLTKLREGKMVG